MQRYIDADALRYIESDKDAYTEDWNDDYEKGFSDAINKVLELPTADVEPVKGWISVKERLPKDNGIYMVWYNDYWDICEFDVESQTFGETYDEYDEMYSTFVCWDDSINKLVTHWMPLPEPPKE